MRTKRPGFAAPAEVSPTSVARFSIFRSYAKASPAEIVPSLLVRRYTGLFPYRSESATRSLIAVDVRASRRVKIPVSATG